MLCKPYFFIKIFVTTSLFFELHLMNSTLSSDYKPIMMGDSKFENIRMLEKKNLW